MPYNPMPYNPYATPGNPYAPNPMAYTSPFVQNQMQAQQSPVTAPTSPGMAQPNQNTTNGPWVLVNGVQGAREVMVQPNQTIYMMSQNSNEFYVKAADNMGVANMRCFRFNEFDPNAEMQQNVQQPQVDYVTREEVESIIQSKIDAFGKSMQKPTIPKKKESDQ